MGKTTIEVRVSEERKAAARGRARAQGMTLSTAIRRLLDLWTAGDIDLVDLERLPTAPTAAELADVGEALALLRVVVADVVDKLNALRLGYGDDLTRRSFATLEDVLEILDPGLLTRGRGHG